MNMSGRATAGGIEYQSRVIAFVCTYVLAERSLDWVTSTPHAVPVAVQAESGGPGDDLRIEFRGTTTVFECQAKRGLDAGSRLDDAVDRFAALLPEPPDAKGIICVDSTSSASVRIELREDLDRAREGVDRPARSAMTRLMGRLDASQRKSLHSHLHIVQLDVELDSSAHCQAAITLLASSLQDPSQAATAWRLLVTEAQRMCREGGRRTKQDLVACLESCHIKLGQERAPDAAQLRDAVTQLTKVADALSRVASVPGADERDDALALQVRSLLDSGRPRLASELVRSALEQRTPAPGQTRGRLLALEGAALLALDQVKEAVSSLEAAVSDGIDDAAVYSNLAQAELALGNQERALDAAQKAVQRDGSHAAAWSVMVQVDDSVSVPNDLLDSTPVVIGRVQRLLRTAHLEDAIATLEGLDAEAHEPDRSILLAQALVQRARDEGFPPNRQPDLERAETLLTHVIEAVTENDRALGHALLFRSSLRQAQDRRSDAIADLVKAHERLPGSWKPVFLLAMLYLDANDVARADALLASTDTASFSVPPLQLLRARIAKAQGRLEDAHELIEAVGRVASASRDAALAAEAIEGAIDVGWLSGAQQLIAASPFLESWMVKLLNARIARAEGDDDKASKEYDEALTVASGEERLAIVNEYAVHLLDTNVAQRAVQVLEAADPITHTALRPTYGRALYQTGAIVPAIGLLEAVEREGRGVPNWAAQIGAWVAARRGDVPAAVHYNRLLAERHPDQPEYRLRLGHALLRQQRSTEANAVLETLVDHQDKLLPRQKVVLAQLLGMAEQPTKVLDLAYDAWHQDPDDEAIQLAYIQLFVMREGSDEDRLEAPKVIGPDTHVTIALDSGEKLQYLLVDGDADRTRGELPLSDPFAASLQGRAVGDGVVLRAGTPSAREGRITELKSKYVHAFQDTLLNFNKHHPESTALHQFKLPDEPTVEDLEPILRPLKDEEKAVDYFIEQNRRFGGYPLGSIAETTGRRIVNVYWLMASAPNAGLFVEANDTLEASLLSAGSGVPIVLTRSALITADEVGVLETLPELGRTLMCPQSLLDLIDEEWQDLRTRAKKSPATLGIRGGQPAVMEAAPEAYLHEAERVRALSVFLREHCEVRPRSVGSFDADAQELREILGDVDHDALCLARETGAVLWADDLGLRRLPTPDARPAGMSSYALVVTLARTGHLSAEAADAMLAQVFLLQHENLPLRPQVLVKALETNGFHVTPPVSRLLSRLGGAHVDIAAAVDFGVEVIARVAVDPLGRQQLAAITYAIADASIGVHNARATVALYRSTLSRVLALLPSEAESAQTALAQIERKRILGQVLIE